MTHRIAVLIAASWALGSVLGVPASAHACCEPMRVAHHRWLCDGTCGEASALVTDDLGGLYLLRDDVQLVLHVSRNDGVDWEQVVLPNVPTDTERALAGSAAGDLIIAFGSQLTAEVGVLVSHDQGRTFEPPLVLHADTEVPPWQVSVAMGREGVAVVTWQGRGADAGTFSAWAAVSGDAGRTWSPPAAVGDPRPGAWAEFPVGAVQGRTVLVAWNEFRQRRALVDRSDDLGRTWGTDQPAGPGVDFIWSETLRLDATGGGTWLLSRGEGGPPAELHAIASDDDAVSWLAGDTIVATGANTDTRATAVLPDGRVLVAWTEVPPTTSGRIAVAWSSDRGRLGTWSPPETLFDRAAVTEAMAAAVDPNGDPWLVTAVRDPAEPGCDWGPACMSIYLSRNCVDDRLAPVLRVDDDSDPERMKSKQPRIAVTPSGRVHVVWVDLARDVGIGATMHAAYEMAPPAPSVDFDLPGLLFVSKSPGTAHLAWTDSRAEATGYDVYEGTVASLWNARAYDHEGVACAVPRTPAGAAASGLDRPLPAENAYFLIAVANCGGEGPVGRNSLGAPRPLAGAGAPCGPMPR